MYFTSVSFRNKNVMRESLQRAINRSLQQLKYLCAKTLSLNGYWQGRRDLEAKD